MGRSRDLAVVQSRSFLLPRHARDDAEKCAAKQLFWLPFGYPIEFKAFLIHYTGLENRRSASYRGFESLPLRHSFPL